MASEITPLATLQAKIDDFLAQHRIAVAGISATRETPGNMIYRKLKESGHAVFAISPTAEAFYGAPCYPDLESILGGVDGVVIATRPRLTEALVRQCITAGVPRVWMHASLIHGGTSVSQEAMVLCREHGITLIAGSCPMMHCAPVDFGHRCMRWIMQVSGDMPE